MNDQTEARTQQSANSTALAAIDAQIDKANKLLAKLKQLRANPNNHNLMQDEDITACYVDAYRKEHMQSFPQKPDGSYPITPIEEAVAEFRYIGEKMVAVVQSGLNLSRNADRRTIQRSIDEIQVWKSRYQGPKDKLSALLAHDYGLENECVRRLQQLTQERKKLRQEQAEFEVRSLEMDTREVAALSTSQRMDLLKRGKLLREKQSDFLDERQRTELGKTIAEIRKATGVAWWKFWV